MRPSRGVKQGIYYNNATRWKNSWGTRHTNILTVFTQQCKTTMNSNSIHFRTLLVGYLFQTLLSILCDKKKKESFLLVSYAKHKYSVLWIADEAKNIIEPCAGKQF